MDAQHIAILKNTDSRNSMVRFFCFGRPFDNLHLNRIDGEGISRKVAYNHDLAGLRFRMRIL